jgi:hypothetical protein
MCAYYDLHSDGEAMDREQENQRREEERRQANKAREREHADWELLRKRGRMKGFDATW